MDRNPDTDFKAILRVQWEMRMAEKVSQLTSDPQRIQRCLHTVQRKQEELRNLTKAAFLGS